MVLVALQDQLLDTTHEELSALYPDVTFRKACDSRAPALCRAHAAMLMADHGSRMSQL